MSDTPDDHILTTFAGIPVVVDPLVPDDRMFVVSSTATQQIDFERLFRWARLRAQAGLPLRIGVREDWNPEPDDPLWIQAALPQ